MFLSGWHGVWCCHVDIVKEEVVVVCKEAVSAGLEPCKLLGKCSILTGNKFGRGERRGVNCKSTHAGAVDIILSLLLKPRQQLCCRQLFCDNNQEGVHNIELRLSVSIHHKFDQDIHPSTLNLTHPGTFIRSTDHFASLESISNTPPSS